MSAEEELAAWKANSHGRAMDRIRELEAENERLHMIAECPTCAERGYDNADYHRLHRAWCDSVAEVERLRAALADCLDDMEQTRASGDAGFWDWKEGDVYSRGRKALAGTV
jgi:hypothetical protein